MKTSLLIAIAAAAVTCIGTIAIVKAKDASTALTRDAGDNTRELIDHGRYLVQIAGCNDCHTPGYAVAGGKVDEQLWLTGDPTGWQGAWGTTYASNLRLFMNRMSENQWMEFARSMQPRPPMPWFNVHAMSDRDLKSLYYYVRAMGPAGEAVPAYVPPGEKAKTPVIVFP